VCHYVNVGRESFIKVLNTKLSHNSQMCIAVVKATHCNPKKFSAVNSQSSTAFTHCTLISLHFTNHERKAACVELERVIRPGVEPGPLASEASVCTTRPPVPYIDTVKDVCYLFHCDYNVIVTFNNFALKISRFYRK